MTIRPVLLFAASLVGICSYGCQSEADAFRTICDSPRSCEACAAAPPSTRMEVLYGYVQDEVSDGDALAFYESMGGMEPSERAAALRRRASEAGIEDCALAAVLERASEE